MHPFVVAVMVFVIPLLDVAAKGQSQSPQKPHQRSAVTRASWTPTLEKNYGITVAQFRVMGLTSLTTEQEYNLFAWIEEQKEQAKKSVPAQIFRCSRPEESSTDAKPDAYDKVRVDVTAEGDASEVISGVRERLRNMNGIQVVYGPGEADLTVSLVARTTETTAGHHTGVAISYVVQEPCVQESGTYRARYGAVENQGLEVGSNVSSVLDSIASRIDTADFEGQRQRNAFLKKLRENDSTK